jgi:preprotein translocase subunit SecA
VINNLPPPKKKIPKLLVMGNIVIQQLLQYAENVEVVKQQEDATKEQLEEIKLKYKADFTYELPKHLSSQQNEKGVPYKRSEPKIGRNQTCPCGSGKKHKHCCINKA